ncbi:sugar ABC transporter substrate-binding protein [Fodinicurvata sp. EGI_FJ10296]|uniref:sugar ABC transporter substrate-binding protein n=1 Tax=Fodinicurvata sp. EGI_FJ10296 TaxID=3231908 RepID=UPI003456F10C
MRSTIRFAGLTAAAAVLAVAGHAPGVAQADEADRMEFIVVSHGAAADPFWSVVINGVNEAAAEMDVDVTYRAPERFDMVEMQQLLDAAIAADPDGIVVTIPDADALGGAIEEALAAGIPVISMNTGADVYADFGILAHVGQTEYEAGVGGGERMAEQGVTNAICINHEVGNVALDQRCEGFQEGLGEDATVEVLSVDPDPTDVRDSVVAHITRNPDVEGLLAVGPVGMHPSLDALRQEGVIGDMVVGSFDLSPEILEAVESGEMAFAIDQQQYLQGYLPIVLLKEYNKYGVMPAGIVRTGPGFVTQENAADVIDWSAEGYR